MPAGRGCASLGDALVVGHLLEDRRVDSVRPEVADPHRGRRGGLDHDGVARGDHARLHDAQVRPGTAGRREAAGEVVVAHADAELVTGLARLGDLEDSRPDPPPVADAGLVEIEADGGEVLAEHARPERGRDGCARARPPVVVLGRVGVHGLVGAAVDAPVGLVVAMEVHALDGDRPVDRVLPDRRGHVPVLPAHRTRSPDVDRPHGTAPVPGFLDQLVHDRLPSTGVRANTG